MRGDAAWTEVQQRIGEGIGDFIGRLKVREPIANGEVFDVAKEFAEKKHKMLGAALTEVVTDLGIPVDRLSVTVFAILRRYLREDGHAGIAAEIGVEFQGDSGVAAGWWGQALEEEKGFVMSMSTKSYRRRGM
jgi:hypothetical protein